MLLEIREVVVNFSFELPGFFPERPDLCVQGFQASGGVGGSCHINSIMVLSEIGVCVIFLFFGSLYNALNNRVHEEALSENGQEYKDEEDEEGHQSKAFYIAVEQVGEPETQHHSAKKQKKEDQEGGNKDPGEIAGGLGEEADALQPVDLHPGFQIFF
jgi:hypothetical protein